MNEQAKPDLPADWEMQLLKRVREVLAEVKWLEDVSQPNTHNGSGSGFDAVIRAAIPGLASVEFWVMVKLEPRTATLFALSGSDVRWGLSPRDHVYRVPVLAAPVVGPRLAEVCARRGWGWIDLVGNGRVCVPPYLHFERTGIINRIRFRSPGTVNLGTPEAARVLHALLRPSTPDGLFTQRRVQQLCRPSVSLGFVNKLLRHLRDEEFLGGLGENFRIYDSPGLLKAWKLAYSWKHMRQLRVFSLKRPQQIEDTLGSLKMDAMPMVLRAAFSAADTFAPVVRQPKTWLMVSSSKVDDALAMLEPTGMDSGANVVLLIPPDDGPFFDAFNVDGRLPSTSALQTYLDVGVAGGRGEEAAEALYERVILPEWKRRELL